MFSSVYSYSEEYSNNCNLNVEKYHADNNFTIKCIEIFLICCLALRDQDPVGQLLPPRAPQDKTQDENVELQK